MRDPARINRILEKLQKIWFIWQDQRLGQVISNLSDVGEKSSTTESWLYHMEDEEWENKLDKLLINMEGGIAVGWGRMLFLDRIWMVEKDKIIED